MRGRVDEEKAASIDSRACDFSNRPVPNGVTSVDERICREVGREYSGDFHCCSAYRVLLAFRRQGQKLRRPGLGNEAVPRVLINPEEGGEAAAGCEALTNGIFKEGNMTRCGALCLCQDVGHDVCPLNVAVPGRAVLVELFSPG